MSHCVNGKHYHPLLDVVGKKIAAAFMFHTGHPYHQLRLRVRNYLNVAVKSVVLEVASVLSLAYLALLFAAATAPMIKSCKFIKELQPIFKRMRSVLVYGLNIKIYHTTYSFS